MSNLIKSLLCLLEKCYIIHIMRRCIPLSGINEPGKEEPSMDVMNLARDVIRYSDRHGKLVSNLKLQKTLYYIQGYCLKFFSRKAFDNAIVHWAYGPVVLDAYYGYSIFGGEPITLSIDEEPFSDDLFAGYSPSMKDVIEKVINKCNACSAPSLVRKTHEETPWMDTKRNEEITADSIQRYFKVNDPLGIKAE